MINFLNSEKKLLELGFEKQVLGEDGFSFTDYTIELESVRIIIHGISLVEINPKDSLEYITFPNCDDIEKLKNLINLFK